MSWVLKTQLLYVCDWMGSNLYSRPESHEWERAKRKEQNEQNLIEAIQMEFKMNARIYLCIIFFFHLGSYSFAISHVFSAQFKIIFGVCFGIFVSAILLLFHIYVKPFPHNTYHQHVEYTRMRWITFE